MYILQHASISEGSTIGSIGNAREHGGEGEADALGGLAEELVGGRAVAHAKHGARHGAGEAVVLDQSIKTLRKERERRYV